MTDNAPITHAVTGFYRVFCPEKLQYVDAIVAYAASENLTKEEVMTELYNDYIGCRYIQLEEQRAQGVSFPAQRSAAWFAQRKRVRGSVTGSQPAGWFFDLGWKGTADDYKDNLAYIFHGKKKVFPPEAIARMEHGNLYEETALHRFLEWSVQNGRDMYVHETGFRRNTTYKYLGASPDGLVSEIMYGLVVGVGKDDPAASILVRYFDDDGEIQEVEVCGKEKVSVCLAKGQTDNAKKKMNTLDEQELFKSRNFQPISEKYNKTQDLMYAGVVIHGVLEIKCPQKMYSSVPEYYIPQMHMEMHTHNVRHAYFVVWQCNKNVERTRVWKVRFNDGYWEDFINVVQQFRSPRGDNEFGTAWNTFYRTFTTFKTDFKGNNKFMKSFITPYFEKRKFSYTKPWEV